MLRFVFTRDRAIESRTTQLTRDSESDFGTCSKPGYGESDSSKIAFGRVRIATCRVRLDRLKAASHDSQMLVITTSKRPTT